MIHEKRIKKWERKRQRNNIPMQNKIVTRDSGTCQFLILSGPVRFLNNRYHPNPTSNKTRRNVGFVKLKCWTPTDPKKMLMSIKNSLFVDENEIIDIRSIKTKKQEHNDIICLIIR